MTRVAAAIVAAVLSIIQPGRADSETLEIEPGISLHVERIGSGPETIIIPGGFLYGDEIRALARPERTLVLYDMRNRGRSSPVAQDESISLQADIADLERVRRHVGAERASLVGYSYLGLVVALYAAEHPERVARIVQLGPVPMRFGTRYPDDLVWRDSEPVIPADQEAELARLREAGLDRADPRAFCLRAESLSRLWLVADPRHAERIDVEARCALENEWPVNLRRHLRIHFQGSVQHFEPPREALQRLQAPVLTLHGTMDRNAPFAAGVEWAMTLPNARLIIAPRAAHQLWLERPQALEEIDRFLGGEWPASAIRVTGWQDVRTRIPGGLAAP